MNGNAQIVRFKAGKAPALVDWEGWTPGEGTEWVHLVNENPGESAAFLRSLDFHEIAIEDAVSTGQRPELKEFSEHLFLVVPLLCGGDAAGADEDDFDELAMFVKGNLLVTVSHQPNPCLQVWKSWSGRALLARPSVQHIVYLVIESVLSQYFPRLDAIEEQLDEIGDDLFEGKDRDLAHLLVPKRRLVEFRRKLGPMRDVMNGLIRRPGYGDDPALGPYFRDLFDNTLRLIELVDTNRDSLTGLLDIHLSSVSNNLNVVMKKMTVISTVLMVGSLIAGIYGMNLIIPESNWKMGYPFALGLMLVAAGTVLWMFRRKRWI